MYEYSYQSDQDTKVNQIEKNVDTIKKEHSKKISVLENTLFNLVHGKPSHNQKSVKNKPATDVKESDVDEFVEEYMNLINVNQKLNLPGDPALRETQLLTLLHKEFSGIRHDLSDTKWKLEQRDKIQEETKRKLNRTSTILAQTTEKLINTEGSLRKAQEENQAVKTEIVVKEEHVEKLKTQLKEVKTKKSLFVRFQW